MTKELPEDLVKVYCGFPKVPQPRTFQITHIYSIPQFGTQSFTLKNCISIIRNMKNLIDYMSVNMNIRLECQWIHVHDCFSNELIGSYKTYDVAGSKYIGKILDLDYNVFIIKSLYSGDYYCPVFHFFRTKNDDANEASMISKEINSFIDKSKVLLITRVDPTLDQSVYISRCRMNTNIEELEDSLLQLEDAMMVTFEAVKYRNIINLKHNKSKFTTTSEQCILMKAMGLTDSELLDLLQKIRHIFNILVRIRPFIMDPNAVDIVHSIFPCFTAIVNIYGIYKSRDINIPPLGSHTLKFLLSCLTSVEYSFLESLGENWFKPLSIDEYCDVSERCYSPMFYTNITPPTQTLPHSLPEENTTCPFLFNDYRIVRCNYTKKEETELTVLAGEFMMVLLTEKDNCFVKNTQNEFGFVSSKLMTSPLDLNFYSDPLISSVYNRMKYSEKKTILQNPDNRSKKFAWSHVKQHLYSSQHIKETLLNTSQEDHYGY